MEHEPTNDGRAPGAASVEAAALRAAGVEPLALIALVRAGVVLDPLGRTADELAGEHDERRLAARGFRVLRVSFGLVRKGAFAEMLAWELAHGETPLPDELARLHSDDEFAARMRAIETQSARIEGARRSLMAQHMQRVIDMPGDAGPRIMELAAVAAAQLHLTGVGVERRMTEAWTIVTELPAAHVAAADGRITMSHLRVIESETRALRLDREVDADDRARVVDELVAVAATTAPGRLRASAKRIVDDVLTNPLQVRHDTARQRRRVELFDAGDGMSDIVAHVPALEGAAILDRLTQAARGKAKDDPRSYDQFRADAFQELLLAGIVPEDLHGTSTIRASVALTMPATELLRGAGEGPPAAPAFPAMLDSRVLIDGDTARRLVGDSTTWERLFTDPVTGVAVTVDTYRPTAAQRRWLLARDGRCRAPGCGQPARRSDLDHTRDFAKGGTTSLGNLEHLCRRDHTLKHAARWSVEQLPRGVLRWTSPIGQVIDDEPEPVGPRFTDMPHSVPKAPKLSQSEKRRRRREAGERLRAISPVFNPGWAEAGTGPARPLPSASWWHEPEPESGAPPPPF